MAMLNKKQMPETEKRNNITPVGMVLLARPTSSVVQNSQNEKNISLSENFSTVDPYGQQFKLKDNTQR